MMHVLVLIGFMHARIEVITPRSMARLGEAREGWKKLRRNTRKQGGKGRWVERKQRGER